MSQRNIALGLHVSRNTVAKVVAAYKSTDIPNEMFNAIDDDELHRKFYPNEVPNISAKMPDKFSDMIFDERMAIMIDKEYDARTNNRIKRLLKKICFTTY